jgi:hypothetical protein
MPVPVSPCDASDTNGPATFKPATLVGTLVIPALTHIQTIHSSTTLGDAFTECLEILDAQYRSLFGLNEEIELDEFELLSRKLVLCDIVIVGSKGLNQLSSGTMDCPNTRDAQTSLQMQALFLTSISTSVFLTIKTNHLNTSFLTIRTRFRVYQPRLSFFTKSSNPKESTPPKQLTRERNAVSTSASRLFILYLHIPRRKIEYITQSTFIPHSIVFSSERRRR